MKTVKHPGPLMRLRIANEVAKLRGRPDRYLEGIVASARQHAAHAALARDENTEVYWTAYEGAVEALRKEQS